jgi:glycine/D-amino acid oxidase-like deaminating enzyme
VTETSSTADVVIIGAGVNGSAIAFFLASRGIRDILIVDAQYPAAGASSRGMGIIRTYHANAPEAALAVASLRVFRDWASIVGGTCGFQPTGFAWLEAPERAAALRRNVAMVAGLGGRTSVLSPAELAALQPHLDLTGVGLAAYEPDCGCASGALATEALLAGAQRMGARLQTHQRVLRLTSARGAVTGVITTGGPVSSGLTILAAGAWSAGLAATAGILIPVQPRRLTTGRIHLGAPLPAAPCTLIDGVIDTSFRPEPNGAAVISMRDRGFGQPVDPAAPAGEVGAEAIDSGLRKIRRRMPALGSATAGRTWTGVDGFTPDHKGIYGAVEGVDGLLICAGSSEKGFKVAPAVGQAMAELAHTGACRQFDLTPFSAARFDPAAGPPAPGPLTVAELL